MLFRYDATSNANPQCSIKVEVHWIHSTRLAQTSVGFTSRPRSSSASSHVTNLHFVLPTCPKKLRSHSFHCIVTIDSKHLASLLYCLIASSCCCHHWPLQAAAEGLQSGAECPTSLAVLSPDTSSSTTHVRDRRSAEDPRLSVSVSSLF